MGQQWNENVFGDDRDTLWMPLEGRLLGFVDENKNGKTDLFNDLAGLQE